MSQLIQTWAGAVPIGAMPSRNAKSPPQQQSDGHVTEDMLRYIEEHPDSTLPEIGEGIGILPNLISALVSRWHVRGKLVRTGRRKFYRYRMAE